MKKLFVTLLILLSIQGNSQQTDKWGDLGNGSYANPVIPGDYSDIDAIRVGSDYYAISSTFQFSPGVIILHSKDLVNWQILGHLVNDLNQIGPELNWDRMNRYGHGIWAGAIRYHEGKFWVYFCTPDEGFFMSTATNPAGTWEPLHKMWGVAGWDDCCPFWDDDGQGYLITTNYADNYKIHLFKMSKDGKQLDMQSDSVIHQSKGSEANKLYKIKGLYYHFFSEVKPEGRVTMMERSKNIYGPYEIKQLNHVNPGKDKEPNQGGIIQNESGDWWFFTHQGTGDWEGRAACLLPVTWIDGWPIIGKPGNDTIGNMVWDHTKPIKGYPVVFPQTNDEFNYDTLAVQWEWNYQPRKEKWSLTEHKGFARLHAFLPAKNFSNDTETKTFFRVGNILTQRSMRTKKSEVTVKIRINGMADGQLAGLCHFSKSYSSIGLIQEAGIRSIMFDNNGLISKGPRIRSTAIWLKSVWGYDGNSKYFYSIDGKIFLPFGKSYKLKWGFYRGDRIGIYSYNHQFEQGYIDIDWFKYKYSNTKKESENYDV